MFGVYSLLSEDENGSQALVTLQICVMMLVVAWISTFQVGWEKLFCVFLKKKIVFAGSTTCGAAPTAGSCLKQAYCTGSTGACPIQPFQDITAHCTGSSQGNVCDNDAGDHCSGTGNVCVDAFKDRFVLGGKKQFFFFDCSISLAPTLVEMGRSFA